MKHVAAAFPDAAAALTRYAEWLAGAGVERGLIGPRETDRIWSRHIGNCAALVELIPGPATVIDIGSGAGLPGLVLSIIRPDLRVTLIEPLQRRCDFLSEVVADLELEVRVVRGRAQEVQVPLADVITARAVAPLPQLLTWALPLVAPGGQILAIKGANAAAELAAAGPQLASRTAQIVTCGADLVDPVTTVVRITS